MPGDLLIPQRRRALPHGGEVRRAPASAAPTVLAVRPARVDLWSVGLVLLEVLAGGLAATTLVLLLSEAARRLALP